MSNGIIQLPYLGNPSMGRWGNQLFTLAFSKAYADSIGAVLEIPENWIGRAIFPHFENYPAISRLLPFMQFHHMPKGETNIALTGFYQNQQSLDLWKNKPYKQWFEIRPEIMIPHNNVWEWFTELQHSAFGEFLLCHRRSGDYIETPYPILSHNSYRDLRNKLFRGKECLFLGDKENAASTELPQLFDKTDMSFISDFIYLMLTPVLFRGNSSFSWWSATLSPVKQRVFSPMVQGLSKSDTECIFIEGNHPAFLPYDAHHTDLNLV